MADDVYATDNIRCASRHLLHKPSVQNRALKDVVPVVSRGQRLTNPMFSRVSERTAFHISYDGNFASCFRCPMSAYNVCWKTTWTTNQRKER